MADRKGVSYRINLDRTKTTKWAQAQPVDYGGDDWGEDDYEGNYPGPAPPAQPQPPPDFKQKEHTIPGVNPTTQGQRSFMSPQSVGHGRNLSFDQQDDRDLIYPNVAAGPSYGFEPQPLQAQRPHSTSSQNGFRPGASNPHTHPPLQLNTQFQASPALSGRPGSRSSQQSNSFAAPLSATSDRSAQKPGANQAISRPENSSLASDKPDSADVQSVRSDNSAHSASIASKPLPFVRPADIYKRMEEEREKERQSQELTRPNISSAVSVIQVPQPSMHHQSIVSPGSSGVLADVGRDVSPSKLETVPESGLSSEAASPQQTRSEHLATNFQTPGGFPLTSDTKLGDPHKAVGVPAPNVAPPTLGSFGSVSLQKPSSLTQPSSKPVSNAVEIPSGKLPNFQRGVAPQKVDDRAFEIKSQSNDYETQPSVNELSSANELATNNGRGLVSPLTSAETLHRSSSTSTSGISPVATRHPGGSSFVSHDDPTRSSTLENLVTSRERPESTFTIRPSQLAIESVLSEQTADLPNFEHSINPAGADSASILQAKSAITPIAITPEGRKYSSRAPVASDSESLQTPLATQAPSTLPKNSLEVSAADSEHHPSLARTASEDWQEWRAQRQSFHAQHGIADSNSASPTMSSPIFRAETPAKGTVREITDRLENNAGNLSPRNALGQETSSTAPPRLMPLPRLDSFRPFLPGGWQSDTSTPTLQNLAVGGTKTSERPLTTEESRTVSTDSIPTASAPKNWQAHHNSTHNPAFAAATAAGTAMAGAFSGPALTRSTGQYSDSDSSDEEWDRSPVSQQPPASAVRDFVAEQTKIPGSQSRQSEATKAADSSSSSTTYATKGPLASAGQTPVDFPAPLRTSKTNEGSPTSSRPPIFDVAPASPPEDPEQLQKEIVQSLTPKASIDQATPSKITTPHTNLKNEKPRVYRTDTETTYDDVLPQEYSSYWMERVPTQESVSTPGIGNTLPAASRVKPNDPEMALPLSGTDTVQPSTAADSTPADHSRNLIMPPIPQGIPHSASATKEIHQTSSQSVLPVSTAVARPILEQRFSWDATPQSQTPALTSRLSPGPLEPAKPVVSVAQRPSTPPTTTYIADVPASGLPVTTPNRGTIAEPSAFTPTTNATDSPKTTNTARVRVFSDASTRSAAPRPDAMTTGEMLASFPKEKVGFKSILAYGDPQKRIRAFDDNKRLYAEPNGLLDNWLSAMNVPEHADVFSTSRQARTQPTSGQPDGQTPPRPPMSGRSGTQQMQEESKRLLAAAGKYGGKAGFVAKGLFAKGKDKLRTVSASDKVSLTSRRKSANEPPPPSPLSIQSTPSIAPQLALPKLDGPVEEVSWSLISSTIDQVFNDPAYRDKRDSTTDHLLSQLGGQNNKRLSTSVLQSRQLSDPASDLQPDFAGNSLANQSRITSSPILPSTFAERELSKQSDVMTTQMATSINPLTRTESRQASNPVLRHQSLNLLRIDFPSHNRRPSSVSDISEASKSPTIDNSAKPLTGTIGPPPEDSSTTTRSQEVPIFLSHDLSKEAEARQEREANVPVSHGSLPPYSGPGDKCHIRSVSGPQVVPVGDLRTLRLGDARGPGRPFSLVGTETMSSVPSYHPGSPPPPMTPTDGQQRRSQIGEKREPNILDHPAYRSPGSEQAPISSPDRVIQQRTPTNDQRLNTTADTPERGYRIPGPYIQEYRPPKPKPSRDQHRFQQTQSGPVIAPVSEVSEPIDRAREQLPSQQDPRRYEKNLATVTTEPISRHDTPSNESGMPRNQSQSEMYRAQPVSHQPDKRFYQSPGIELAPEEKKRRKVLFRLNSSGLNSSSALDNLPEEGGPQPSQVSQAAHKRLLSSDLLKNKAFSLGKSTDGKKKRSSGLAGFFSRSNRQERGRSTTPVSQTSDNIAPLQQPSTQSLRSQATSPGSVGGYSTVSRDQTSPFPQQHPRTGPLGSQYSNSAYHETRGYYEPSQRPGVEENNSYRNEYPDLLWVNTSSSNTGRVDLPTGSTTMTPYPAISSISAQPPAVQANYQMASPPVPITRANRDISYGQDRGTQGNMADHVMNLHKRSRSPRLGRPPSDERLVSENEANENGLKIPGPATSLGTFTSKKASPVGTQRSAEDQEKPWTLTLPSGHDADEDDDDEAYVMVNHEQADGGNLQHATIGQLQINAHEAPRSQQIEPSFQESVPTHDHTSSGLSAEAKRALFDRAPSPFLSSPNNAEPRPATHADRLIGAQHPSRSTTPTVSPPTHHAAHLNALAALTGQPQQPSPSSSTFSPISTSNNNNTTTTTDPSSTTRYRHSLARTITPPPTVDPRTQSRSPLLFSPLDTSTPHIDNLHSTTAAPSTTTTAANPLPPSMHKSFTAPVELPGSKPSGYESDDEPVMSATAYPGQEWMPVYADDGRWDD